MSHRLTLPLFLLILAAGAAAAAPAPGPAAAQPGQPVVEAGIAPGAAAPAATIDPASVAGPGAAGAAAPVPSVARPAPAPGSEEAVLEEIMAESRAEVAALGERLAAASDPQEQLRLQHAIVQAKTDARLRFLQAKVDFARERGDEAAAQEALLVRDHVVNPPKPAPVATVEKRAPESAR